MKRYRNTLARPFLPGQRTHRSLGESPSSVPHLSAGTPRGPPPSSSDSPSSDSPSSSGGHTADICLFARLVKIARRDEPGRLPRVAEVVGGFPSRKDGVVVVHSTRDGLNILNQVVVVVTVKFGGHATVKD